MTLLGPVLLFAVKDTLLRDKAETQAHDPAGMAKAGPIQQQPHVLQPEGGKRNAPHNCVTHSWLSESKYLYTVLFTKRENIIDQIVSMEISLPRIYECM